MSNTMVTISTPRPTHAKAGTTLRQICRGVSTKSVRIRGKDAHASQQVRNEVATRSQVRQGIPTQSSQSLLGRDRFANKLATLAPQTRKQGRDQVARKSRQSHDNNATRSQPIHNHVAQCRREVATMPQGSATSNNWIATRLKQGWGSVTHGS